MSYDLLRRRRLEVPVAAMGTVPKGARVRVAVLTKGLAACLLGLVGGILMFVVPARREQPQHAAAAARAERNSINLVRSLAFAGSGRYLATTSNEGLTELWDLTERHVRTLGTCTTYCFVAASPDGRTLAVCDASQTVKLIDPTSGAVRSTLEVGPDEELAGRLAFSPDGQSLVASQETGNLWLFDLRGRRPPIHARRERGQSGCLSFTPDGAAVATARNDGLIEFWSCDTGPVPEVWRTGKTFPVFAYAPDGKTLAFGGACDPVVEIADIASHRVRIRLRGHQLGIKTLAFAGDGRTLATVGFDGELIVWDTRSGRPTARLAGDTYSGSALAFSPGGATLAVGESSGIVRLWKIDEIPKLRSRKLVPHVF